MPLPGRTKGRTVGAMDTVNVMDFERIAGERLSKMAWDYYQSGAGDEITLRENRAAFDRVALHYRVLVDVSKRELSARVLGHELALPVLIAPCAFQKLAHPDGELATTAAAGAAGTIMILSTLSTTAVEDVVKAASGPVWFQLYVYKDRAVTEALVKRVEAAGCTALVLTVDAPLLGRRERDMRNHFTLPPELAAQNLLAAGLDDIPASAAGSGLAAYFASLLDPSLSWNDLDWLASLTRLPVVVKGIVRPDDACRAVAHGARGIIVSNHGGRQLDTAPATMDVIGSVAGAVGQSTEVLMDGGIRRGTDIVKALAAGARAVLIGRPALWGLAAAGAGGVTRVLGILRDELDLAMALCGCRRLAEIGPDLLNRAAVGYPQR